MSERFLYSSDLPIQTQRFLHSFDGFNVNQVGKKLGGGIAHRVYEYYDPDSPFPEVIKIPRYWWHIERPTADRRIAEQLVMDAYFGPYMLPTKIFTSKRHPYYIVTQQRLNEFTAISRSNFRDVYPDLKDLLERNNSMIRNEGLCADLLGKEGVERSFKALVDRQADPIISNLVINRDGGNNSLVIMDSFPIPLRRSHYQANETGTVSWLSAQNTYWINNMLIRRHWGLVIG